MPIYNFKSSLVSFSINMTEKQFLNAVANAESDILQSFLAMLRDTDSRYCVIGGLGVNAYVDPVVSLDLDIVVIAGNVEALCGAAQSKGLSVEHFEHYVNLSSNGSDLRIQLQMDSRYQDFISRGTERNVLGYDMKVAALEDVLQGKVWAYSDETRRRSKRQKDLADISRLVEAYPELEATLPENVNKALS